LAFFCFIYLYMCFNKNLEKSPAITKILMEYLTQATREIQRKAGKGEGKEILGEVINRPEDIEIAIDRVGEDILERLVKKHKLNIKVYSEPDGRDIEAGGEPDFYGAIDPFDGTVLYLRGFEHNWYTALSFFDKDKKPLASGVADILRDKIYISDENGNFLIDRRAGTKIRLFPSQKKDLSGQVVIATYLMSPRYAIKFWDAFAELAKNFHPKTLLYPQGGSFIYSFLAAGLIDAYVMFDEPRSEIDPGYGFARKAGCSVVSVNPDGSFEDYQFEPGRQHDKVDLLVAACTPELRDQIIKQCVEK